MKKVMVLAVVALLLIAPCLAVKPSQTSQATTGIQVASPVVSYLRSNSTYTFNYHLFNLSNGMPITSGVSCVFHLYAPDGSHQYVSGVLTTFADIYDVEIPVNYKNFSKGFYNTVMHCNGSAIGGFSADEFEITQTGYEPNPAYSWIFIYMIVLAELVIGLYLLFHTLQHTFVRETDLKMLGMNYMAWFSLFVVLALNQNFIGSMFAGDMLNWLIKMGIFTNMLIPTIGFIWSFIMNRFKDMQKMLPGGKNPW